MAMMYHVGVSGGKDSTALLLWTVYESGYPTESVNATFCDTGNEAPETYAHIAMLNERVHPITTLTPPRNFYELARYHRRFPSPKARFCTQELKMAPTQKHVRSLQDQGHEVLMLSGVRANESFSRSTLSEREPAHMSYFGAEVYRPLLRWSVDDVRAIHERYNIPRNPLYAAGCMRVGCLPCIMSRKAEIANIATRWPERIDRIREAESLVKSFCNYSSMFARGKVPLRYRSKTIHVRPRIKGKLVLDPDGNPLEPVVMQVATIDDVVKWATEGDEPVLPGLEDEDAPAACDTSYGACE